MAANVRNLTTYKISIWKVDSEESPLIIAEQMFQIDEEVYILGNKLNFSQDGLFIFVTLIKGEKQRTLYKCLTFDA
jgi:hypothetical protein